MTRSKKIVIAVVLFTGIACLGACSAFVYVMMGMLKWSDAYADGMAIVEADSHVIEILGSPIESAHMVTGSISVNGSSGVADIAIPVSGPNGEGTVYIKGFKEMGEWRYASIIFRSESVTIDLTPDYSDTTHTEFDLQE